MKTDTMTAMAAGEMAAHIARMQSRDLAWDKVEYSGDPEFIRLVSDEIESCADTDDLTPLFLAKAIRRVAEKLD